MALKAVMDAVEARLGAAWTTMPILALSPNPELPQDGSPFVLVQYPLARSEQISFGSPGANVFREKGAFRVLIHARRDTGLAAALTWADEIAAIFRGQIFDGVQCFAPSSPAIDDRNDQGNYLQLSLTVPYQYDLIG